VTLISLESDTLESTLPSPQELLKEIPLTPELGAFVHGARAQVEAILNGWDARKLLIVGPCSIHDPQAALEYGIKLRALAAQVSEQFFVIMRTYFEKPRTIVGWKGMLYDPDLDGSYQMAKGLRQTRELLLELTELGLPVGCELLEINTSLYYSDLLSWGCVGARTCSSPPHRQLAATLNLPIGFKNSIDGNIDPAIHGILSAATPHVFLGLSPTGQLTRIKGEGNENCHIVLRGGIKGPNYHREEVQKTIQRCQEAKVCDRIMIDCSHDNCGKNPLKQGEVFLAVLDQILEGNSHIGGMMLESHLEGGAQELSFPLKYGVSITDPCLDWQETERLVLHAFHSLIS
jgi:3-deoxy-7-phosphoheptulonate synthase